MGAVADFVAHFLGPAQDASAATGVPVDFILGQAGLESSWGTSRLATQQNNLFGIGGPGRFASYASPSDSFSAWAGLMRSPRYADAVAAGGSADQLAGNLAAAGYTPDPGYAAGVAGAVSSVDAVLAGSGDFGAAPGQAQGASGPGAAAGSSAGQDTTQPHGASCGLSPACWLGALGSWAGNLAARAGLIVLAVILLLGGVWLLATRTQATAGRVPV